MEDSTPLPAEDYVAFPVRSGEQDWLVTWYPADDEPEGQCHGAAGICLTADNKIVLITQDGTSWGLPGGRPEDGENWEDTMRREVKEEACVEVDKARLLGFSHGLCSRGHEEGLLLIRSLWLADAILLEWAPEPQILGRNLVPVDQVLARMAPDPFAPLHARALLVADLL